MKFNKENIYQLLPSIHQIRDHELVGSSSDVPPLKALLSIIAEEVEFIEDNIDQLYDDFFIETCSEWAIPYIGQLVGNTPLIPISSAQYSSRTEVANTIAYRRRKGTLAILEQLARDLTNWDATAVEYFKFLSISQYLNHLRQNNIVTPDLRNWEQLEFINTPFDSIPRTADMRNINSNRGKYNIPNIGIFLFRIQASSREESMPLHIDSGRFTFHPTGLNTTLYNFPKSETSISQIADVQNMPVAFNRKLLREHFTDHYGLDKDIYVSLGPNRDIEESEICIGDLSNWLDPTVVPEGDKVVIDPSLGRLMFGADFIPELNANEILVWYNYGSIGLIGGGEYSRPMALNIYENRIIVSQNDGLGDFTTLQEAIDQAQTSGVNTEIEILDNKTYVENISIQLQSGQSLEIRCAQGKQAVILLSEDINIEGEELSELILNGLIISGGDLVIDSSAEINKLCIKHCTLQPANSQNLIRLESITTLQVENSILTGIETSGESILNISNTIIDAIDSESPAIGGAPDGLAQLTLKNSTVNGEIHIRNVNLVENSILISPLKASFLQSGCIRFSYLPLQSESPRKYSCYPTTEAEAVKIKPLFNSRDYGDPAYFQNHNFAHKIFLQGADDASELGAYHDLYQSHKQTNLRTRLNEYMKFGMEAGIFYAS